MTITFACASFGATRRNVVVRRIVSALEPATQTTRYVPGRRTREGSRSWTMLLPALFTSTLMRLAASPISRSRVLSSPVACGKSLNC